MGASRTESLGRPWRAGRAAALLLLLLVGAAPGTAQAPNPAGGAVGEGGRIPVVGVDDARLEARLRAIYAELRGLGGVKVRVRSGVVHLSGEVARADQEALARSLAARLEGVVYVEDDLSLPSQTGARLAPATERVAAFFNGFVDSWPLLVLALGVLAVFWALGALVARWRAPFERLGMSQLSARLAASGLRWGLVLVGVLLGLNILDVMTTVGAVIGALGLVGVALGFAFRDVISSYLPGLFLSLNPPFDVGDRVRIGEREGHVVRMTARETVLLATDGVHLRIPNAVIFAGPLLNLTRNPKRRLDFTVPLAPSVDLRAVRDLGRDALLGVDGVLADPPPFMRTQTLTEDFVEVRYFAWVDQTVARFHDLESRSRRAVMEALRGAGVELPVRLIGVRSFGGAAGGTTGGGDAFTDEAAAEARAERFLEEEVRSARARSTERDLLTEARRRE